VAIPGVCAEGDQEGKCYLYADGKTEGEAYDAKEVAGSKETYVFGGFRAKNREFIDSLKTGTDVTSSPFRDCLKTMEVAERILAQALLEGK
jgi:hypothetical protein